MSDRLKGKVAVITGSGQGIGKATAKAMAIEGAKVITNNRRSGSPGGDAETAAKEIVDIGGQAIPFFGDISDFKIAEKLIQTALDNFGRVDILVNNAGGAFPHMIWNMTEEDWNNCLDSHLKGAFNCIRHVSAHMKQQGWGRILNATSWDRGGASGGCNYAAAMAGIIGLSKSVALDLGRFGITCNVYSPVATTGLREVSLEGVRKRYDKGGLPKYRWEEFFNAPGPEVMTPLLVYLCTDEAADINGQVFEQTRNKIYICSDAERKRSIFKEGGLWAIEELVEQVPMVLLKGYKNPAPAQPND